MNIPKEYIKMCEKADLDWNGEIGDLCSDDGKTVSVVTQAEWHQDRSCGYWEGRLSLNGSTEIILADQVIPIYRQDQLQEMVKDKYDDIWNFIKDFEIFVQNTKFSDNDSMEQLWLAFVMSELYQKHWDGNNWRTNSGN